MCEQEVGPSKMNAKRFRNSLEGTLAHYVGTEYAVGTSMGRTALLALLKSLDLSGGEVIVPGYTCEVVPNAVLKAGGIPVFVDTNEDNYRISLEHLNSLITGRTKAIVVCHTFGHTEDFDQIASIASGSNDKICLIEDAAHALGAEYHGKRVGGLGNAAILSFTKNMVGLGGGAVVTNDPSLATRVRHIVDLTEHSSARNALFFGALSFLDTRRAVSTTGNKLMETLNRLPNLFSSISEDYFSTMKTPGDMSMARIQAGFTAFQLGRLDHLNEWRNRNRRILDALLGSTENIDVGGPDEDHTKPICIWYVMRTKGSGRRNDFIVRCRKNRLFLSSFWDPLPIERYAYNTFQTPADVPNARRLARKTLVFKMSHSLSRRKLERVARIIEEAGGMI